MPNFVLNRTFTMATLKGHVINFEKGQPTWVPPECIKDAVAIGAVSADGDTDSTAEVLGKVKETQLDQADVDREATIFAAFAIMEERNGTEEYREDFNAQGLPNVKALEKITDFPVSAKERNVVWEAYLAAKAK